MKSFYRYKKSISESLSNLSQFVQLHVLEWDWSLDQSESRSQLWTSYFSLCFTCSFFTVAFLTVEGYVFEESYVCQEMIISLFLNERIFYICKNTYPFTQGVLLTLVAGGTWNLNLKWILIFHFWLRATGMSSEITYTFGGRTLTIFVKCRFL